MLAALAEKLETCEVDAEELLFSPHTLNRHLYMLVRGQLSVQLASRDNPPVRYVEVNDCVGEVSFCDHRPPSTYVIASEPSRVVRLHSRELPLLTQSPELMQNLIELLCDRVRLTDQLIINSEHNANIDMLTGVFNRRWLEHIFERESARCAFSGQPLCMLMIDVDEFKPYNDRHGHIAGDHALCQVARLLGTQLRPKDSLVRFGGEEFVTLLPELDLPAARLIAERLRQRVAQNDTIAIPTHRGAGNQQSRFLLTLAQPLHQLLGELDATVPEQRFARLRPRPVCNRRAREVDHGVQRHPIQLLQAADTLHLGAA